MEQICADAFAEQAALDDLVAGLSPADWVRATPAEGWSIADQISHLWFFDRRALLALTDPPSFAEDRAALLAAARSGTITDASVEAGRTLDPAELLAGWRAGRADLLAVARTVDPATRVPWYGPAMGARSFVTARLMEAWAHGHDIADALGAPVPITARLRHVAHIGVQARPFSYAVRQREAPAEPMYVRLVGPAGEVWEWGTPTLTARVDGPVLDFCQVVTQRRHLADTELSTTGPAAGEWMAIAQAFAGAPGPGRSPRLPTVRVNGR